jgi:hypothetical protein
MSNTNLFSQRLQIATLITFVVIDLVSDFGLIPNKAHALSNPSQASDSSLVKSRFLHPSSSSNALPLVSQSVDIESADDDKTPTRRVSNRSVFRVIPCESLSALGARGLKFEGCSFVNGKLVTNRSIQLPTNVKRPSVQTSCTNGVVQSSSQSNRLTGDGRTVSQSSSTTNCK